MEVCKLKQSELLRFCCKLGACYTIYTCTDCLQIQPYHVADVYKCKEYSNLAGTIYTTRSLSFSNVYDEAAYLAWNISDVSDYESSSIHANMRLYQTNQCNNTASHLPSPMAPSRSTTHSEISQSPRLEQDNPLLRAALTRWLRAATVLMV